MLNQDEYNQDEYNDYYKNETKESELKSFIKPKEKGFGGKLIALLVLMVLAIAGYFGYNTMKNSSNSDALPQTTQETVAKNKLQEETNNSSKKTTLQPEVSKQEVKETVQTQEKVTEESTAGTTNVQEENATATNLSTVQEEVVKAVSTESTKMSPKEIADVVKAVMEQMNQKKETTDAPTPTVTKKDGELMDKLSGSEVDSVSSDLEKSLNDMNIDENTHVNNTEKQVDVYNKVNVQDVKGSDTLSQLANQITDITNEAISQNIEEKEEGQDKKINYTQNLKKEVIIRENEMRIIVVQKGDTLGKLAKRAYGNVMEFKKIYQANPEITRPDRIYVGQKIRIPN